MTFVIPAPAPQSLPVAGRDERFPVSRIFCVGRNYAEHAREMGNDPDREPPFFFSKPATALVQSGATTPYPTMTQNLHFEGELVIALEKGGQGIAPEHALDLIFGYAAGNDLTRRDLQGDAKKAGRPWDMAKGFDNSAVVGAIRPVEELAQIETAAIETRVNGEIRQSASIADMIWPIRDIVASLSQLITLRPGDLIMTGTPAGVGPLETGDNCVVEIEGLSQAMVKIS